MAEVEQAKRVLFEERKAVFTALHKADKRRQRLVRELATVTHIELPRLLVRGKRAGVPVTEMADAIGITRQMAHRLIKNAEETERLVARSKTQREEVRDA